jgi:hypothetical protein
MDEEQYLDNELILSKINLFFEFDKIEIEDNTINIYENNKIYLSFSFLEGYNNYMEYYVYLKFISKSKYSGKETLKRFELFLKYINTLLCKFEEITSIKLGDKSKIELWGKYTIPAYTMYILSSGESFYTNLGYIYSEYNDDKKTWKFILEKKISYIFEQILKIPKTKINSFLSKKFNSYELDINIDLINKIKKSWMKIFGNEIENLNVQFVFSMLFLQIKNMEIKPKHQQKFYELLIVASYFIKYNEDPDPMNFQKNLF